MKEMTNKELAEKIIPDIVLELYKMPKGALSVIRHDIERALDEKDLFWREEIKKQNQQLFRDGQKEMRERAEKELAEKIAERLIDNYAVWECDDEQDGCPDLVSDKIMEIKEMFRALPIEGEAQQWPTVPKITDYPIEGE